MATHETLYDRIGRGYGRLRKPDPRIGREIRRALGDATSVVNVGAGTGSYEPSGLRVVAVEPSITMIRQRAPDAAPAVQALASNLPFFDKTFDASLAILTIHHWPNVVKGLQELARTARRRVVILTWDPSAAGFWLVDDYFPQIRDIDREICPTIDEIRRVLGRVSVSEVLIPYDCTDGFLGAYWCRPEAYLISEVRGAISTFSKIGDVDASLERLRRDLTSGDWHRRHGSLLDRESLDLAYRLVVTEPG